MDFGQSMQTSRRLYGALALLLTLATLVLSGCNTVAGMGEDTQAAGRAVEHTAEDVKK